MITYLLIAAFVAAARAQDCCYDKTFDTPGEFGEAWSGNFYGCDIATLEEAAQISSKASLSSLIFSGEGASVEFNEGASLLIISREDKDICEDAEKSENPEEVATYAAEYASEDMCSFNLCIDLIEPTYAGVFDTCITLDAAQLAGTKSSNLALSMVDAEMKIKAEMTGCATGQVFSTETNFVYSSTGGTQTITLILIEEAALQKGLSDESSAFAPILTSFTAPLSVPGFGVNTEFNTLAVSMSTPVVRFDLTFTERNDDRDIGKITTNIPSADIIENIGTKQYTGAKKFQFDEAEFGDYKDNGKVFPVAMKADANAIALIDGREVESNSITTEFIIDPTAEMRIDNYILKGPNLVGAKIDAGTIDGYTHAVLGEDTGVTFSLQVNDPDFNTVIPGYTEDLTCDVTVASAVAQQGGCDLDTCSYLTCDPTDVSTIPGKRIDTTKKFEFEWIPSFDPSVDNYGVSLCTFEVVCSDSSSSINSILPNQPVVSNQVSGKATYILQAVRNIDVQDGAQDIPIVTRDFIAGSTVAGKDSITAKVEVAINVGSLVSNVAFGYYDRSRGLANLPLQTYDSSKTFSNLILSGNVMGIRDNSKSSGDTSVFSATFEFSRKEMEMFTGTTDVDVKFTVGTGESAKTYVKSLISKLRIVKGRRDRRNLVADYTYSRQTRQSQQALPIAPFKLKFEGDQMFVEVGNARMIMDIDNNTEIEFLPGTSTVPNGTTVAPESEDEELSSKTEIWVLAVIATGALLLVAFVIVLVVVMKHDNGRRSSKVMPFWTEGAVPQYTPKIVNAADVKAMEAGKVNSTSF